jgi:hypothetical protein
MPGTELEHAATGANSRLEVVELAVSELKSELHDLQQRFEQFTKQFE